MELKVSTHIRAPIEKAFELASDFVGAPEIIRGISNVEMLTPGPVRVGTRFRETRKMFGRDAVEVMEVTAFDPPTRYVLGCENHGCRYRTSFAFRANGDGTDIDVSFRGEPLTGLTRFMMKVTGGLGAKACENALRQELEDLKAELEAPDVE